MKNNENVKKKVKIIKMFKKAMGCMMKIKMNNLPSLPPMIFKEKRIREKNRTINNIIVFQRRKKAISSKKSKHSRIPKIKTTTQLYLKKFFGILLYLKSK
ncbi:MAG: hypothetical protein ACFFBC_03325 [Promethearchaeota archaeon]